MSAYDIFEVDPGGGVVWTCSAESVAAAHQQIKNFGVGDYFIFDHRTQQRIRVVVTEAREVKVVETGRSAARLD